MLIAEVKKQAWYSKIKNRDDALQVVKAASVAFFLAAALTGAFSLLRDYDLLLDAIVYAVGAFFLRRSNSRAAAVILLLTTTTVVCVTFANMAGANLGGGKNIFLAVILLGVAIRAVEATFKLHSGFAEETQAAFGLEKPFKDSADRKVQCEGVSGPLTHLGMSYNQGNLKFKGWRGALTAIIVFAIFLFVLAVVLASITSNWAFVLGMSLLPTALIVSLARSLQRRMKSKSNQSSLAISWIGAHPLVLYGLVGLFFAIFHPYSLFE